LELHDQDLIDGNLKVSEFIENKKWNINKLRHYIQNPNIIHKILGIPIPIVDITDSFCWGLSSMGEFTTKSATWLAHHPFQDGHTWPFNWIWKEDTMPKIKIFLWQLCQNALPVRDILFRRGCRIDPQCSVCLNDIEITDHLFGTCSLMMAV